MGRRTVIERTAYLLLHLSKRAEERGLTEGDNMQFPFLPLHVVDALGISLVHTNNTLRRLADSQVMRWGRKTFQMLNRERMWL